jgi:hypothetical protein
VLLIRLIFETLGALWLLFIIMLGVFGGKVDIQLRNPITKKFDTITDITIEH